MMNALWWNKAKPWVVQIGLLVLIALTYWFGVRPLLTLIQTGKDEIQQLDVLQEHRSAELQRLPELEKQNELIRERAERLNLLPNKDALVAFIQELERLADESGVRIEIASQDNTLIESKVTAGSEKPKAKGGATENDEAPQGAAAPDRRKERGQSNLVDALALKQYIRLSIVVRAPYRAMVEYLHRVETMPYAVEVVGLAVREIAPDDLEPEIGDALTPSPTLSTGPLPILSSTTALKTEASLVIFIRE